MDIRNYFNRTPPSSKSSTNKEHVKKPGKKRVIIDSDEDDDFTSPKIKQSRASPRKESKSKSPRKKQKIYGESKYIEVNKDRLCIVLGHTPVKRVNQPSNLKLKKKKQDLFGDDDDDDFMSSLQQLDSQDDISKSENSQKSESSGFFSQSPQLESHEIKKNDANKESPPAVIRSPRLSPRKRANNSPISSGSPKRNRKIPFQEDSCKTVKVPTNPKAVLSPVTIVEKKPNSETILKRPAKEPEVKKKSSEFKLWVEKYKPSSMKQIIGQQGDKSNVNKLIKWLNNWYSNHSRGKKIPKPSPWAKDDSGAFFKAALLSGPPGVGKTTTAHLVCKELGMDVVEFNASDTRSKKLLSQEVSELLTSKSLTPYFQSGEEVSKKHVLVMDEVDGMAGNEDRGGVQELIQLIKTSKVPVICMCNDRNHPKIRSLANYCFDLRFHRVRAEQIKAHMLSVCFKEKLKIKGEQLTDIIVNTNQDIRLILNHLSMLAANLKELKPSSKDVKMGPWDVIKKVFSQEDHKTMTIHDKSDLFFHDYSIAPLFVQENYLQVVPHSLESKSKLGKIRLFAKAAQSIAYGDMVDKAIRSNNAWSLLPTQAMFSSLVPGDLLEGHMGGMINFPQWLGKNSRRNKLDRQAQEIQLHTRLKISGSKEDVVEDYARAIRDKVIGPLVRGGSGEVPDAIEALKTYSLLREDIESLNELTNWPVKGYVDQFAMLDSKVKAAFTRAYNKDPLVTTFSGTASVKKKAKKDTEDWTSDIEEASDDENMEETRADALIVAKKETKPSEPGTSKQNKKTLTTPRGRGGGRGRGGRR